MDKQNKIIVLSVAVIIIASLFYIYTKNDYSGYGTGHKKDPKEAILSLDYYIQEGDWGNAKECFSQRIQDKYESSMINGSYFYATLIPDLYTYKIWHVFKSNNYDLDNRLAEDKTDESIVIVSYLDIFSEEGNITTMEINLIYEENQWKIDENLNVTTDSNLKNLLNANWMNLTYSPKNISSGAKVFFNGSYYATYPFMNSMSYRFTWSFGDGTGNGRLVEEPNEITTMNHSLYKKVTIYNVSFNHTYDLPGRYFVNLSIIQYNHISAANVPPVEIDRISKEIVVN